jgi:hypothetical protein
MFLRSSSSATPRAARTAARLASPVNKYPRTFFSKPCRLASACRRNPWNTPKPGRDAKKPPVARWFLVEKARSGSGGGGRSRGRFGRPGRLGGLGRADLAFDPALTTFPFLDFVILCSHNGLCFTDAMRSFFDIMKGCLGGFNSILGLLALAGLVAGCKTEETYESNEQDTAKQLTALRLHIQTSPDPTGRSMEVPVFRSRPVLLTIDPSPFLTEQNVTKAEIVDELGGFSIRIELERQGKWLLEKYTAANMGRRIAIFANFGHERWLAAPVIQKVIADGKLTFTPDATREEADRIVRGLKNVAAKMDHDPRF